MSDACLYGISFSHPSRAARLMLEHKGIDYRLVKVRAGMQAVQVRLAGFNGGTVPALRIDGRRALGTLAISRLLDEICPQPPLFPADPARRRAVEQAEAWGDGVLQPIPRRLLRWALRHDHAARVTFGRGLGTPLPQLAAVLIAPVAAGTIGGQARNAADFQIATTIRVMLACADFEPLIAGRPAERLARGIWPDYRYHVPAALPPQLTGAIAPG